MKTTALISTALMMSFTLVANAGHSAGYRDTAKVIDVQPVYRTEQVSEPERSCWDEEVERYIPDEQRYTGTVLGGIIGGVVANSVSRGRGRGRDAATLAGTLLGGAIGHDLSHARHSAQVVTSRERHCEVVQHTYEEERLQGYDVTYRYKGRIFHTFTQDHPGERIPVNVSVRSDYGRGH
ncbi:MAG: glycine zipper 2TM domain-containing protein [Candidatus Thiodiazotropha sp.]